MAILNRLVPLASLPVVLAFLAGTTTGCSAKKGPSEAEIAACKLLAQDVTAQDDAFVARVRSIRTQHILVRDYDRQMIEALNQRRIALEKTTLTELSVNDDIAGCSGDALDDMRRHAHSEMLNLRSYLNDFERALKTDPADVFIDQSR